MLIDIKPIILGEAAVSNGRIVTNNYSLTVICNFEVGSGIYPIIVSIPINIFTPVPDLNFQQTEPTDFNPQVLTQFNAPEINDPEAN